MERFWALWHLALYRKYFILLYVSTAPGVDLM